MDKLTLLTANVRGLKNKRKRHSIVRFQKLNGKYDSIALQECHITTRLTRKHSCGNSSGEFYSLGINHSLGQITLVSKKWAENAQCLYTKTTEYCCSA